MRQSEAKSRAAIAVTIALLWVLAPALPAVGQLGNLPEQVNDSAGDATNTVGNPGSSLPNLGGANQTPGQENGPGTGGGLQPPGSQGGSPIDPPGETVGDAAGGVGGVSEAAKGLAPGLTGSSPSGGGSGGGSTGGTGSSAPDASTPGLESGPSAEGNPSGIGPLTVRDIVFGFKEETGGRKPTLEVKAAIGQTVSDFVRMHNPSKADADVDLSVRRVVGPVGEDPVTDQEPLPTDDLVEEYFGSDFVPRDTDPVRTILGTVPDAVDEPVEQLLPPPDDPLGLEPTVTLDEPNLTVPAGDTAEIPFRVTVPDGTEPGEYPMAIVADVVAAGEMFEHVIPLGVTVPGGARPDYTIENIRIDVDSGVFPRTATVLVELQNQGRVRLRPTVLVDGEAASGPDLLLTDATERYLLTKDVPWYGGPIRYRVDTRTRVAGLEGPADVVTASAFVVPWHLLPALLLAAMTVLAIRAVYRRRHRRLRVLSADLRRMERLLEEQRTLYERMRAHAPVNGQDPVPPDPDLEIRAAVRAKLKQAERANDPTSADRLRRRLEELEGRPVSSLVLQDRR